MAPGDRSTREHDLALPVEPIATLLARYRDRHPGKTAIVDLDTGSRIDFAALHEAANRVANFLADRDIGPGDRVALLSEESLEKLIIWLGIWRLGAVVCPLNVEMNEAHVGEILANIEPRLTFVHEALDADAMGAGSDAEREIFGDWDAHGHRGRIFSPGFARCRIRPRSRPRT